MELLIGIGVLAVFAVLVIWFILSRMRVVDQTHAMLVSGSRGTEGTKVVKPGGRAFIIPVIQSFTLVPLTQMNVQLSVSGVDKNKIGVEVSGVAMVKVRQDDQSIRDAAERFGGDSQKFEAEITHNLQQVLTGSLRSAVAAMTVEELLINREQLASSVKAATDSEASIMGLIVDSLQVLEISDKNGYISALGARESEKVKADARVAKAENARRARDAEVTSEQNIAERDRDLALRRSELQGEQDKASAIAGASGPLAKAEQDRAIAKLEQETAQEKALLRERQLDTEVRRPADADRYRQEQAAEAAKRTAILNSEARAEETRLAAVAAAEQVRLGAAADAERVKLSADADAQSTRAKAGAEAEAVKVKGDADASAVAAVGGAEAEAMNLKAEAYEKYGEAAITQLLIDKAPEIARALAEPMSNIDKLTVISTDGASALPKAVANNFGQLDEVMGNLTGASLSDLMKKMGSKTGPLAGGAAGAAVASLFGDDEVPTKS